jgi:hypothetical protein
MLYFIHHSSGNVVIRTNNPFIVLQHQRHGWLTATSLDEVLLEHPEWGSDLDPGRARHDAATKLVSRFCGSVLAKFSPTLALVPSYTPSGTVSTISLLSMGAAQDASVPAEGTGANPIGRVDTSRNAPATKSVPNTAPMKWMTAVERKWYRKRGLQMPETAWTICTEGDEAFDYRLMFGVWDVDENISNERGTVSAT